MHANQHNNSRPKKIIEFTNGNCNTRDHRDCFNVLENLIRTSPNIVYDTTTIGADAVAAAFRILNATVFVCCSTSHDINLFEFSQQFSAFPNEMCSFRWIFVVLRKTFYIYPIWLQRKNARQHFEALNMLKWWTQSFGCLLSKWTNVKSWCTTQKKVSQLIIAGGFYSICWYVLLTKVFDLFMVNTFSQLIRAETYLHCSFQQCGKHVFIYY